MKLLYSTLLTLVALAGLYLHIEYSGWVLFVDIIAVLNSFEN